MVCRALILSVGGTPEPLAKSIGHHRPQYVCFFASQQTVVHIGEALGKAGQVADGIWGVEEHHTVLAENAEDLVHCYERAVRAAEWVRRQGIPPGDVIVDYTGGTKTMSAALALATIGNGFGFSYVGGKERTKGGLGIVVNGSEVVRAGLDPWRLFAVEERRRIALAFNSFQFDAALSVLEDLIKRQTLAPADQHWYEAFRVVCEGYRAWDRFEYREALDRFRRINKSLTTLAELVSRKEAEILAAAVAEHVAFLGDLAEESNRFQSPCSAMVRDLLGNAERRARGYRYDDAVSRLYRATEMIAQIRFRELPLDASTSDVPLERIPENLREEYRRKYLEPGKGTLRVPLFAAFRVLQSVGAPEGQAFALREKDFLGLIHARNQSLLAHGFSPVSPETYERFRGLLRESFQIDEPPTFPQLPANDPGGVG